MKFRNINYPFWIIVIILLTVGFFSAYSYYNNQQNSYKSHENYLYKCEYGEYKDNHDYDQWCQKVINAGFPKKQDIYLTFAEIMSDNYLSKIQIIGPIFIALISLWNPIKKIKSGFFKNELLRTNYKKYIKKAYLSSLKYAMLLPIFILYIFILSGFISNWNFNIEQGLIDYPNGIYMFDASIRKNVLYCSFFFITNIFLHSILYINLGFISLYNSKNYFMTVIESYLLFLFTWISSDLLVADVIMYKLLKIPGEYLYYFSLTNIWPNSLIAFPYIISIYAILLIFISFIVLYFEYFNKEKVIIKNE